jgi:kumamolisin
LTVKERYGKSLHTAKGGGNVPKSTEIPKGYRRLEGSERRPAPKAEFLGPADPKEKLEVTIVLRRRPDGPPVPKFDYFATTPPSQRRRMPTDEFAAKYGAAPSDIDRVTKFVKEHGLTVVEANAARRSVVVSGTVAQMSEAFAVTLGRYQHTVVRRRHEGPRTETYRGRDGFIHIPHELAEVIIGVFGLDNRRITKSGSGDPPNTTTITIPQVRGLYQFPTNSAAGQTIAIFSEAGYQTSDITNYFSTLPPGYPAVIPTDISVDASNDGSEDLETTQDICIAATAAPGAAIAVYFTSYTQQGWVDLIHRVVHPSAGDPQCSVLSSSFYVSNGDDANSLMNQGISTSWLTAVDTALQDAAIQGVTVCICSGDDGSDCGVGDGKAHVTFPASDPWVLGVGGTTVGNIIGSSFDEYVWNDTFNVTGFYPSVHGPWAHP